MMTSSDYSKYTHFKCSFPVESIIHVEINRPSRLNAFDTETWTQYGNLFNQISNDSNILVVVLSGSGNRAFSAGLDIQQVSSSFPNHNVESARRGLAMRHHIRNFQKAISAAEECCKPVIGVSHGICYGLGIDILCAVDIRIASKDTRFSVKEIDIGITADIGSLQRLPKCVGNLSWIKEIALTGRDFNANEAISQGFISNILDNKQLAIDYAINSIAKNLIEKSPTALIGTKHIINHAINHTNIYDGLDYIATWNSFAIGSDMEIALKALAKKKSLALQNYSLSVKQIISISLLAM